MSETYMCVSYVLRKVDYTSFKDNLGPMDGVCYTKLSLFADIQSFTPDHHSWTPDGSTKGLKMSEMCMHVS